MSNMNTESSVPLDVLTAEFFRGAVQRQIGSESRHLVRRVILSDDHVKAEAGVPQEAVTGEVLRGYGPRRGNLEALIRYWRPIMKKPGGFRRCVVILADHPKLYPPQRICAWLHHEITGKWPNEGNHHGRRSRRGKSLYSVKSVRVVFDSDGAAKRMSSFSSSDFSQFKNLRSSGHSSILEIPLGGSQALVEYKALLVSTLFPDHLVGLKRVGAFGSNSRVGQAVQGVGSMIIPGDISDVRSPVRSQIYETLTPGGGRDRNVVGRARRLIPGRKPRNRFRCPPGFENGGTFTNSNFTTCGAQVLGIPSLGPGALSARALRGLARLARDADLVRSIGDLRSNRSAYDIIRAAQIPVAPKKVIPSRVEQSVNNVLDAVGNVQFDSRVVRRDGVILEPVMSLQQLSTMNEFDDLADGVLVDVYKTGQIAADSMPTFSTGLRDLYVSFGDAGAVRVRREGGELSADEQMQLRNEFPQMISRAADLPDVSAGLYQYVDSTDGRFSVQFGEVDNGKFTEKPDKNKLIKVRGRSGAIVLVPQWVYETFLSRSAPRRPKNRQAYEIIDGNEGKQLPFFIAATKTLADSDRKFEQYYNDILNSTFLYSSLLLNTKASVRGAARDVPGSSASAIFDSNLNRYRCPPGTRYGGRITDKFGRNCGFRLPTDFIDNMLNVGESLDDVERSVGKPRRYGQNSRVDKASTRLDNVVDQMEDVFDKVEDVRPGSLGRTLGQQAVRQELSDDERSLLDGREFAEALDEFREFIDSRDFESSDIGELRQAFNKLEKAANAEAGRLTDNPPSTDEERSIGQRIMDALVAMVRKLGELVSRFAEGWREGRQRGRGPVSGRSSSRRTGTRRRAGARRRSDGMSLPGGGRGLRVPEADATPGDAGGAVRPSLPGGGRGLRVPPEADVINKPDMLDGDIQLGELGDQLLEFYDRSEAYDLTFGGRTESFLESLKDDELDSYVSVFQRALDIENDPELAQMLDRLLEEKRRRSVVSPRKPDAPKPDAPKPDAPKPDAPKPDGRKPRPGKPGRRPRPKKPESVATPDKPDKNDRELSESEKILLEFEKRSDAYDLTYGGRTESFAQSLSDNDLSRFITAFDSVLADTDDDDLRDVLNELVAERSRRAFDVPSERNLMQELIGNSDDSLNFIQELDDNDLKTLLGQLRDSDDAGNMYFNAVLSEQLERLLRTDGDINVAEFRSKVSSLSDSEIDTFISDLNKAEGLDPNLYVGNPWFRFALNNFLIEKNRRSRRDSSSDSAEPISDAPNKPSATGGRKFEDIDIEKRAIRTRFIPDYLDIENLTDDQRANLKQPIRSEFDELAAEWQTTLGAESINAFTIDDMRRFVLSKDSNTDDFRLWRRRYMDFLELHELNKKLDATDSSDAIDAALYEHLARLSRNRVKSVLDARDINRNAPEANAPNAPEANAPEANAPEANAPNAPEASVVETTVPQTAAPEVNAPETELPDTIDDATRLQQAEDKVAEALIVVEPQYRTNSRELEDVGLRNLVDMHTAFTTVLENNNRRLSPEEASAMALISEALVRRTAYEAIPDAQRVRQLELNGAALSNEDEFTLRMYNDLVRNLATVDGSGLRKGPQFLAGVDDDSIYKGITDDAALMQDGRAYTDLFSNNDVVSYGNIFATYVAASDVVDQLSTVQAANPYASDIPGYNDYVTRALDHAINMRRSSAQLIDLYDRLEFNKRPSDRSDGALSRLAYHINNGDAPDLEMDLGPVEAMLSERQAMVDELDELAASIPVDQSTMITKVKSLLNPSNWRKLREDKDTYRYNKMLEVLGKYYAPGETPWVLSRVNSSGELLTGLDAYQNMSTSERTEYLRNAFMHGKEISLGQVTVDGMTFEKALVPNIDDVSAGALSPRIQGYFDFKVYRVKDDGSKVLIANSSRPREYPTNKIKRSFTLDANTVNHNYLGIDRRFTVSSDGMSGSFDSWGAPERSFKFNDGGGLASTLNSNAFAYYRELGITDVAVEAAADGKATWPAQGFRSDNHRNLTKLNDPNNSDSIAGLLENYENYKIAVALGTAPSSNEIAARLIVGDDQRYADAKALLSVAQEATANGLGVSNLPGHFEYITTLSPLNSDGSRGRNRYVHNYFKGEYPTSPSVEEIKAIEDEFKAAGNPDFEVFPRDADGNPVVSFSSTLTLPMGTYFTGGNLDISNVPTVTTDALNQSQSAAAGINSLPDSFTSSMVGSTRINPNYTRFLGRNSSAGVFSAVPVGNRGIWRQSIANFALERGAAVSDIPDEFLLKGIFRSAGFTSIPTTPAGIRRQADRIDSTDKRFKLVDVNSSSNSSSLVIFEDRTTGQRIGIKYMNGVARNGIAQSFNEMASASLVERFGLVQGQVRGDGPAGETVARTVRGRTFVEYGTIPIFVDLAQNYVDSNNAQVMDGPNRDLLRNVPIDQQMAMFAFDALSGNTDRHDMNFLVASNSDGADLIPIDHGHSLANGLYTRRSDGTVPTVGGVTRGAEGFSGMLNDTDPSERLRTFVSKDKSKTRERVANFIAEGITTRAEVERAFDDIQQRLVAAEAEMSSRSVLSAAVRRAYAAEIADAGSLEQLLQSDSPTSEFSRVNESMDFYESHLQFFLSQTPSQLFDLFFS